MSGEPFRIAKIDLDQSTGVPLNPDIDHERKVAIFDLLEENFFKPQFLNSGDIEGPYAVVISLVERRLVFDITQEDGAEVGQVILALSPFRRIIKDYFAICDSYYEAIRTATPQQIEAIDMGRRGLHNDGSDLLRERLDGKIELDQQTARRLFTLICVLHMRG